MKWMVFLLLGWSLSTLNALCAPRNVVWIIADDMSPDTGAYGCMGLSTPNLDHLAAKGRLYQRAYATAPVCSASRSAFILGCYQTTTGLHAHDVENPQPLAAPYEPVTELLRKAGWFVTNAAAPGTMRSGRAIKKAKTHYNFAHDPAVMFDGDDWRRRAPGQRFFAQFQITEPHRPFPIPESYDEGLLKQIALPPNYPDHPLMRRDWYAYLRSVEMVDRRVGTILKQLKDEDVLQETLVVFFADHGRPMPWGKQWLGSEGLQVPLIMHGPGITAGSVESRPVSLIDLAPTLLELAGQAAPGWMEGRALLGGTFPERTALFAARDRCGDAADRVRAVITESHWLVKHFHPELPFLNWSSYKEASYPGMPLLRVLGKTTEMPSLQAKYLKPDRTSLELYDLKQDPTTLHNVAAAGEKAVVAKKLEDDLSNWIQRTGDAGALPDLPTEPTMEQILKDKRSDYQRTWKARLKVTEPTDDERLEWWMSQYGLSKPKAIAPQ